MEMENYYEVVVQVEHEVEKEHKGKTITSIKVHKERYLVKAVSVTDVEAKITEKFSSEINDWSIVSVHEKKYEDIIK